MGFLPQPFLNLKLMQIVVSLLHGLPVSRSGEGDNQGVAGVHTMIRSGAVWAAFENLCRTYHLGSPVAVRDKKTKTGTCSVLASNFKFGLGPHD